MYLGSVTEGLESPLASKSHQRPKPGFGAKMEQRGLVMAIPTFRLLSRYHFGAAHRLAVKVRDNPRRTPSLHTIPPSCCHTCISSVYVPVSLKWQKWARTSSTST